MSVETVPVPRPPSHPHRILVVEDAPILRLCSVEVLRRCGYQVDAAEDGQEGWEALCAHAYDLLITDNVMPRMSGVELIRKLRAEHMTLPVILTSGTLPVADLLQDPVLALAAALEKPVSHDLLVQTVQIALRLDQNALRVGAGNGLHFQKVL